MDFLRGRAGIGIVIYDLEEGRYGNMLQRCRADV